MPSPDSEKRTVLKAGDLPSLGQEFHKQGATTERASSLGATLQTSIGRETWGKASDANFRTHVDSYG